MSQDASSVASTSPHNPGIPNGSSQSRRTSFSASAKKGGRTLTAAQLEKKRANDREAQRAIRERTKSLIENLEREIEVLKSEEPYQQLQAAIKEKEAVQAENLELKNRLARILDLLRPVFGSEPFLNETAHGSSLPSVQARKRESSAGPARYSPQPPAGPGHFSTSQSSFSPSRPSPEDRAAAPGRASTPSDHHRPDASGRVVHSPYPHRQYEAISSDRQYRPPGVPATGPIKAEHNPPLSRHSTSSDHPNGYQPNYGGQPPGPFYSLLPANLSPTCDYDRIVYDFTSAGKRHFASGQSLDSICGGSRPTLTRLTDDRPPRNNDDHYLSYLLIDLLKGFSLITTLPEKISIVTNMFEYIRWTINPCKETYEAVPPYMRPLEEQLRISHPIWVDYLPWPLMRQKLLYEYPSLPLDNFFYPYCKTLTLDFPKDPQLCLDRDPETGEMYIKPELYRTLRQLDSWSLGSDFAYAYPKLAEGCRILDN